MSGKLDRLDYYTLLRLDQAATEEQIRAAFRQFARRYHPDLIPPSDPAKRLEATKIYRRGSEAVQVLLNTDARSLYDKMLKKGFVRISSELVDRAAAKARVDATEAPKIRPGDARASEMMVTARTLAAKGEHQRALRLVHAELKLNPKHPGLRKLFKQLKRLLA